MYYCTNTSLSVCPSACLSVFIYKCGSVSTSIPSSWPSVFPSVWPYFCLAVNRLAGCMFVLLSIHMSVCLSVRPSHTHNQAFRRAGRQTGIHRDRLANRWTYIRTDRHNTCTYQQRNARIHTTPKLQIRNKN